jgi:hypothetical protein
MTQSGMPRAKRGTVSEPERAGRHLTRLDEPARPALRGEMRRRRHRYDPAIQTFARCAS